jgi:hypothetical protein
MGEFEIVGSTKEEKGEAVIEIFDQIELYKEQLRKQKDDNSKKKDSEKPKS